MKKNSIYRFFDIVISNKITFQNFMGLFDNQYNMWANVFPTHFH